MSYASNPGFVDVGSGRATRSLTAADLDNAFAAKQDARITVLPVPGQDATAPLNAAVVAAVSSGLGLVVISAPLAIGNPGLVSVPKSVTLLFEGAGQLVWNFGSVSAIGLRSPGRGYTGRPTVAIDGNATLGAVVMQLDNVTVASGSAGTAYQVGDFVTLPGGATASVVAINPGGSVAIIAVGSKGSYAGTLPTGAQVVTGGSGSGLRLVPVYQVQSVAVASGGAYSSGAVPTVTFSGGSPTAPAMGVAIGQRPIINARIAAAERRIFGGYAKTLGAPNGGAVLGAWYGVQADGATDDTAAVQAAEDSAISILWPCGQIVVAGTVYLNPQVKWFGRGATGADGGYVQFGTNFWGIGGGQAMILGPLGVALSGRVFKDLTIATAPSSFYAWAVQIEGMYQADWANVRVQNNWSGCAGGAWFQNENPLVAYNLQTYPPVWINNLESVTFGCAGSGQPLNTNLTDSRYGKLYLSGGAGSIEGGLNNTIDGFMIDNFTGTGLLVAPVAVSQPLLGSSGSKLVLANGNFQNAGQSCITFTPGANPSNPAYAQNAQVSNVNFNNTNSTVADIIITSSSRISLNNLVSDGLTAANILLNGYTPANLISVTGGILPKGLPAGIASGTVTS